MAADKSDAKPAQAADQAKTVKKATKSGTPRVTNEQRTLLQAQVWYGNLDQAGARQLRKRPAPAAAPKAAKKATKKAPAKKRKA